MVFLMATIFGDVQYTQNGTFNNPWRLKENMFLPLSGFTPWLKTSLGIINPWVEMNVFETAQFNTLW